MEHTKDCLNKKEARKRAQERWRERWPNACRFCKANTDCETPCPHCLMELTCPRCGTPDAMHPEKGEVPCTACGYVEGDGCPDDYECQCRVSKAEQLARKRRQVENQLADIKIQERRLRRDLENLI